MARVKYVGAFAEGVVYEFPEYKWVRGTIVEGVPDKVAIALKRKLPKDFLIFKDKKAKSR